MYTLCFRYKILSIKFFFRNLKDLLHQIRHVFWSPWFWLIIQNPCLIWWIKNRIWVTLISNGWFTGPNERVSECILQQTPIKRTFFFPHFLFFLLMACFEFWGFIHVLVVLVWFRMELPKRLFSILEMFYAKFEGS